MCVSPPHIYHTALVLTPKKAIVQSLYRSHAHPLMRIVHGVPLSWDPNDVATTCPSLISSAVWSPCNRFIAVACEKPLIVGVLDSVTLQRLQTLEPPEGLSRACSALVFSPDSHILTCFSDDTLSAFGFSIISWDLQTGGVASAIRQQRSRLSYEQSPITYSADGKMVGVFYYCWNPSNSRDTANVLIFDVASGKCVCSHSLDSGIRLSGNIWAQGELLQFATADAMAITIWEAGFTSGDIPTSVESLPIPSGFDSKHTLCPLIFLPTLRRFTSICHDTGEVAVWDAQNSKSLLHCTDTRFNERKTFSSDGQFFACSTTGTEVYLWKESPTGYILHEILASGAIDSNPLLSQDGKSIAVFGDHKVRLWRVKGSTTTPCVSTQVPQSTENFALDFSPGGTLAAVVKQKDNIVTVLNLRSGVPQLTIDANMEVYGVRVIGETVAVIGDRKVVAWILPTGNPLCNARVGLEDHCWTISLNSSQHKPGPVTGASISPDFHYIVTATLGTPGDLYVYHASTGEQLWKGEGLTVGDCIPWFALDGCEFWCADKWTNGKAKAWRGIGSGKKTECFKQVHDVELLKHPPEGYPWESSYGYQVTDDWWILGPDGKRLLMLPPCWQSYMVQRVWRGHFLALLHGGLPEPVILEFRVNL